MLSLNASFSKDIILLFLTLTLMNHFGCTPDVKPGHLQIHPLPADIPQSRLYHLMVDDQPVPVEQLTSKLPIDSLPDWFTSEPYTQVQQEVHVADFSADGAISIQIELSSPVESVKIRPQSRNIRADVEEQVVTFTMQAPDKLYIEIDSLPELCLFANPLEDQLPMQESDSLIYFGPGIHHPGYIQLQSGKDIYLAAGAYVYGGIRGDRVSDVKIFGRGVLDGDYRFSDMVYIGNCENIQVTGITIRNGRGWTNSLFNCDQMKYDGVKVISFGPSGDGINPLGSRNFEITDCFLRCTDDCIAIKSPDSTLSIHDIVVSDNTMIGYAFSDGITIGFETNGPEIKNIEVRNCDILMSRGGSRVDGHSAFSVICDGPADIYDIFYENIRVEVPMRKLFELQITAGDLYGIDPPGKIKNIHLKNIEWSSPNPIVLKGYDQNHQVEHITFENCTINGQKLLEPSPDIFQMGEYVQGVYFK
ncbi:MAG: hypothetical protein KDC80_16260 [Saprospiraceae bacterium]|nr:hypothetical protein [Saprospiraceae bacterium]